MNILLSLWGKCMPDPIAANQNLPALYLRGDSKVVAHSTCFGRLWSWIRGDIRLDTNLYKGVGKLNSLASEKLATIIQSTTTWSDSKIRAFARVVVGGDQSQIIDYAQTIRTLAKSLNETQPSLATDVGSTKNTQQIKQEAVDSQIKTRLLESEARLEATALKKEMIELFNFFKDASNQMVQNDPSSSLYKNVQLQITRKRPQIVQLFERFFQFVKSKRGKIEIEAPEFPFTDKTAGDTAINFTFDRESFMFHNVHYQKTSDVREEIKKELKDTLPTSMPEQQKEQEADEGVYQLLSRATVDAEGESSIEALFMGLWSNLQGDDLVKYQFGRPASIDPNLGSYDVKRPAQITKNQDGSFEIVYQRVMYTPSHDDSLFIATRHVILTREGGQWKTKAAYPWTIEQKPPTPQPADMESGHPEAPSESPSAAPTTP